MGASPCASPAPVVCACVCAKRRNGARQRATATPTAALFGAMQPNSRSLVKVHIIVQKRSEGQVEGVLIVNGAIDDALGELRDS